MRVVVFSKVFKQNDTPHIQNLFDALHEFEVEALIYKPYLDAIGSIIHFKTRPAVFHGYDELQSLPIDFFVTLGGDGTILEAITHVREMDIPIVGINLGRLGFLAGIEKERIREAIYHLQKGMYRIDARTMLFLESNLPLFGKLPFALNDCTLHKRDTSSMITIHTHINGAYLNSFWLMVS